MASRNQLGVRPLRCQAPQTIVRLGEQFLHDRLRLPADLAGHLMPGDREFMCPATLATLSRKDCRAWTLRDEKPKSIEHSLRDRGCEEKVIKTC